MKQCIYFWLSSASALCSLVAFNPVQAQIVPDATLPVNSNVTTDGNTSIITGGTQAGSNLFHSFEQFSVPTGSTAYFNNAVDIQNIISRVTGSSISNIDGLLRANGTANLFLINPNGIIFGQNARLDVGGSFVASTASSLKFADGTQFSATAPTTTPLLTVSVPIGLQFGANPANIFNQSTATRSSVFTSGLQPYVGKTLALVGGNIALDGGSISLSGGRVELGGVAESGLVGLLFDDKGLRLSFPNDVTLADVLLTNEAILSASSSDIQILGRHVTLTNNSRIVADTDDFESEPRGRLAITALDSVELSGRSSFFTGTTTSENAGDLQIITKRLIVRDGAQVSTSAFREGNGGNLTVNASDFVELAGTSVVGQIPSGLFTQAVGSGNAGNLNINTGQLIVRDGAQVSAATSVSSTGLGGNLNIATRNLVVRDGAMLTVNSQGAGSAGNILVAADSIQMNNQAALTAESASGNGGNIALQVQDLMLLRSNSSISAISGTQNRGGNAGNINIETGFFFGTENSDIIANSFGGPGVNVQINANGFFLSPDSEIIVNGKEIELPPLKELSVGREVTTSEFVDVSGLIALGCAAVGENKFAVIGRGGLPPNPSEAVNSELPLVDLGKPMYAREHLVSTRSSTVYRQLPTSESTPLVEARGWVIGKDGEVVLTATAPNATPHDPLQTTAKCHAFKGAS